MFRRYENWGMRGKNTRRKENPSSRRQFKMESSTLDLEIIATTTGITQKKRKSS